MIPPNAKCVFKGVIFDVYQWEQTMFDGSVEIFERLKRPDTVEVIATVGDQILILEQLQPHQTETYLCLPGGRVDEGENADDAVRRELAEETGYTSQDWELLHRSSSVSKIEWTMHAYIARNCTKTAEQQLDAGEQISTKLLSFDAFIDLVDDDRFRHVDLKMDLMRAKYDPKAREDLKRRLFGA